MIRDPNRFTDPIAVPQRENGDHEPARKLDLIVERSLKRTVGRSDGGSRRMRARRVLRRVTEHIVEDHRQDDVGAARRVQCLEGDEDDIPIGVAERRRDDRHAMSGRSCGRSPDQARPPGPAIARESGDEERDRRLAEPPQRIGRGSGNARLSHRGDDMTDDPLVRAIVRHDRIERGGAHGRVRIAEEADEGGSAVGDDPSRAHRHGSRAPVRGFGRGGEAGDERPELRDRPHVSTSGELDERPDADLGIGMVGQLLKLEPGCLRRDAGKQVEPQADISDVG